tara:strand:+ start:2418 stop:2780 length:363 start_codon:yes stop_codon:yes gene_type:complete
MECGKNFMTFSFFVILFHRNGFLTGLKIMSKTKETTTADKIKIAIKDIENLLLTKNDQYGDSVFSPIRIFSKVDQNEQIRVRIDDKLNRLVHGNDSIEQDIDIVQDLIGYLVLLYIKMQD